MKEIEEGIGTLLGIPYVGSRGWPSTRPGCRDTGLVIHCVAQPH